MIPARKEAPAQRILQLWKLAGNEARPCAFAHLEVKKKNPTNRRVRSEGIQITRESARNTWAVGSINLPSFIAAKMRWPLDQAESGLTSFI